MINTSTLHKTLLVTGLLFGSQTALAQIEGVYKSDGGDDCMHVGWRGHFHIHQSHRGLCDPAAEHVLTGTFTRQ